MPSSRLPQLRIVPLVLLLACFGARGAAEGAAQLAAAAAAASLRQPYAPATVLVRLRQTSGPGRRLAAAASKALLPGVAPVRFVGQHHDTPLPRPPGGSTGSVSAAAAAAAAIAGAPDGAILEMRITDGSSVMAKVRQLRQHPDVDTAEPDFARKLGLPRQPQQAQHATTTTTAAAPRLSSAAAGAAAATSPLPNDPFFWNDEAWHLNKVAAPLAWATSTGSRDVGICVIDTGLRADHEDLQPSPAGDGPRIVKGWNRACTDCTQDGQRFTGAKPAPGTPQYRDYSDVLGHGTHVVGLLAAAANNSRGVAGLTWRASLYICAVMSPNGNFYTSSLLDYYALCKRERVRIPSNSYYSDCSGDPPCYSQLEFDAIQELGRGPNPALFVAAAGNFANNTDALPRGLRFYPGSYPLPNIISVAGTQRDDSLASFSNWGRTTVHLAAPGEGIWSTSFSSPRGYSTMSGTSMATPLVSGAAALLWAAKPSASAAEIKQRSWARWTGSLRWLAGSSLAGG
ncbi:hypothetical protein ABPG75_006596 [Micractinium tetrahymenae]